MTNLQTLFSSNKSQKYRMPRSDVLLDAPREKRNVTTLDTQANRSEIYEEREMSNGLLHCPIEACKMKYKMQDRQPNRGLNTSSAVRKWFTRMMWRYRRLTRGQMESPSEEIETKTK